MLDGDAIGVLVVIDAFLGVATATPCSLEVASVWEYSVLDREGIVVGAGVLTTLVVLPGVATATVLALVKKAVTALSFDEGGFGLQYIYVGWVF